MPNFMIIRCFGASRVLAAYFYSAVYGQELCGQSMMGRDLWAKHEKAP